MRCSAVASPGGIGMSQDDDVKGLKLTLAVYVVIFAGKLSVYFVTSVMALLAEALHTLADIIISGFLLVATYYSRRVADRIHMFGYGRAQNVAALVAATIFISFTSFELYREAIPHLLRPVAVAHSRVGLAVAVLAASMLIALAPIMSMLRRKGRGAAAKTQLMELFNDELGLAAALVGTTFVLFGYPIADPIAAVVVATIIAFNAIRLFRENSSVLLGQAPDPETMARLEEAARTVSGVLGVHELRAEFIGPGVAHATVHVQVAGAITVAEGHAIAREVDRTLEPMLGPGICEVHIDPVELGQNEPAS
jgi:cation diffusion facilitator family transporter